MELSPLARQNSAPDLTAGQSVGRAGSNRPAGGRNVLELRNTVKDRSRAANAGSGAISTSTASPDVQPPSSRGLLAKSAHRVSSGSIAGVLASSLTAKIPLAPILAKILQGTTSGSLSSRVSGIYDRASCVAPQAF